MNSVSYIDQFHRETLVDYVREFRPMIAQLVHNYNSTNSFREEDIDDLLQESIIVFYGKINDPTFSLTAKASTYIYSIAKNKLKEKVKRLNRYQEISIEDEADNLEYEEYDIGHDDLRARQTIALEECIKLLSDNQQEVFKLYIFYNLSMKEIAERFSSSERSMITQKYKAQKNVEECVKRKVSPTK